MKKSMWGAYYSILSSFVHIKLFNMLHYNVIHYKVLNRRPNKLKNKNHGIQEFEDLIG